MPDISMCQQRQCKKKMTCYRYIAEPGYWQSYANFTPKDCEYYEKTYPRHKLDATICVHCSAVVSVLHTSDLLCDNCKKELC